MEKVKLLSISIVLLLISNIVLLVFILKTPKNGFPEKGMHQGPKNIIIKKLHFDKNQELAYEKEIHWHRSNIRNIENQISQSRNELYLLLNQTEVNPIKKDSLIQNIAELQKSIEKTHFKHFQDIKKICKPNQMQYYNDLTNELASLFSGPKHKRPRHRN